MSLCVVGSQKGLQNNINIIYGKNEQGKTTTLKFLEAMFYGASKNKNGKDISDLKRRKRCDECLNKHTEVTKQQLRLKRLEWLKNNPEKHPWKRKDKFLSKPCELFKKYLDLIKLRYISEYNMYNETGHNYSIDIAFPDKKLGIEINGNQHYNKDGTLKKYYQVRHELIEKAGWKLLEIHFTSCFDEEEIKLYPGKVIEFGDNLSPAEIKQMEFSVSVFLNDITFLSDLMAETSGIFPNMAGAEEKGEN